MATQKVVKRARTERITAAKRLSKKTNISKVRARRIGKSILNDYAGAFRKLEKN